MFTCPTKLCFGVVRQNCGIVLFFFSFFFGGGGLFDEREKVNGCRGFTSGPKGLRPVHTGRGGARKCKKNWTNCCQLECLHSTAGKYACASVLYELGLGDLQKRSVQTGGRLRPFKPAWWGEGVRPGWGPTTMMTTTDGGSTHHDNNDYDDDTRMHDSVTAQPRASWKPKTFGGKNNQPWTKEKCWKYDAAAGISAVFALGAFSKSRE